MARTRIRRRISQFIEQIRLRLADADAILVLALVGTISGLFAGLIIILFRVLIELGQFWILPNEAASGETYAALGPLWVFFLPAFGGLVLGVVLQFLPKDSIQVGVIHVMERLAYHQGHLPLRNAVVQFFAASFSIVCGHSVGKEGPSIHLGAAGASLIAQRFSLPNNSIRILVGCGTAAAIAAAFNTPLAGVIFAMEVVMMEYTIATFTPVILAAVSATTLIRVVFGSDVAFQVPPLTYTSLAELPYILLLGLVVGACAASFIVLLKRSNGLLRNYPIWIRLSLAGTFTGCCALFAPEIMGVGYGTVNSTIAGELSLALLLLITVLKLFATTIGLGLGLPGGLIGPTLVIGATLGGSMGLIGAPLFPDNASPPAFYAMLGMTAMMGATLQAPLAALTALVELTANPNILLPGMLVTIIAGMTASELFRQKSVYLTLIQAQGLDYSDNPVAQSLRRIGVASAMQRNFVVFNETVSQTEAEKILKQKPKWILIEAQNLPHTVMPAADLAKQIQTTKTPSIAADGEAETAPIALMEIPAQRLQVAAIDLQASLQEAVEKISQTGCEALYVQRTNAPGLKRVYGILTKSEIESSYS